MARFHTLSSIALIAFVCSITGQSAVAQNTTENPLAAAKDLYATASGTTGADRMRILDDVQQILDQIVAAAPQSDLALDILFERNIDGLDVAAIGTERRQELILRGASLKPAVGTAPKARTMAGDQPSSNTPASQGGAATRSSVAEERPAQAPEVKAEATPGGMANAGAATTDGGGERLAALPSLSPRPLPQGVPPASFPQASAQTEAALGLDREKIREIQSRLTAMGLDPRGVDGALGPGTRGALQNWQASNGIPANGYLDARQLQRLREQSQASLDIWLRDPGNMRLFSPPAPVALTPARLSGSWSFVARCGANSRLPNQTITGALVMRHVGGNQYAGTVRNSAGLNGRVTGRLNGRNLQTEINWGLLFGRVRFSGTFADDARSLSGRDSNGCRVSARAR